MSEIVGILRSAMDWELVGMAILGLVIGKDIERNVLYVGQGFHHEMLYSDSIITDNVSWISKGAKPDRFECTAKFRYRQQDNEVTVEQLDDSKVKVTFGEPIRAVTPDKQLSSIKKKNASGRNY